MKALIIHCTYQYKGGEDTVVEAEARLLRSGGITVDTLLFSNEEGSAAKILQLPFNLGSYRATQKKVRSFKPDIVHIHNLHFAGSLSVFYALRNDRVPFVTTLHNYRLICPSAILYDKGGSFMASLHQGFPWSAVLRGVYRDSRWLTLWVALSMTLHRELGTLRHCRRYIVLSDYAKELFLTSGLNLRADQLVVKQNFFDLAATELQPVVAKMQPPVTELPVGEEYFVYIGRLSEEKGIRPLLDAFSRSGYQLKIAGDGPLRKEVEGFAKSFTRIEYAGPLEKEALFSLLKGCTALVFPSVWPEGMPMTIIEAFSQGIPVIASDTGVMRDMVSDGYNGMHFKAGDSESLLGKLHHWHSLDPDERTAYCRNALDTYSEYYTPERNFRKLISIYQGVLGAARPRQPMKRIDLFGITLHTGSYDEFLRGILEKAQTRNSHYTCVANVHMLIEACSDFDLASVISNAGIVTPDGMPLTWALKWLYGIRQERVAGMDLLPDLLQQAMDKHIPVYFYGGNEALLERTGEHIRANYPDLSVAGYHSPPFRTLTEEESDMVVDRINASGAGLVFVILGCPKQEKWMASMLDRVNAVMIGVGGALPVMVGMRRRAPGWMQRRGLEWLFRLIQEPARLFKRYAVTNSLFIYLLVKTYLFRRIHNLIPA